MAEWLIDELDRDLAARRRELIDLRLLVSAADGSRGMMIARTCQVMAYAHWEGFSKHALRRYLDHLVKMRVKLGDLKYELQALALMGHMKEAVAAERSVTGSASLLRTLDCRGTELFSVDAGEVIRVGNMTSENLRTLLECVALPYLADYSIRENFIDSVVCGRRHRIAHGEWQPIATSEARSVIGDVLKLCTTLNDQVQTAALYKQYLA
ncbi:MAE_28990/MAE_18760 family HEPN-like nuclease [Actinomadura sp. ATCC 31491]|uniref:MAE_28990/MAE_18760 family HEPN-like nuclease n=1 Tax=Actinomadura luzonensis TaxID=2805427 RepID=A0ABT0GCQ6_9ACTN|nr:MAE_28990/MAE_18760 family HEPN-like nuclease [Actinomadura luzonensis]MCK2221908.1 MAE_28990/MAE_18760 family HEPN-like nuclease [Actinomadura luzonensis]